MSANGGRALVRAEAVVRRADGTIEPGTFNVIPAGQLHGPFEAEEESIQFKVFSSLPVYILTDGSTHIYKRDGRTIDVLLYAITR